MHLQMLLQVILSFLAVFHVSHITEVWGGGGLREGWGGGAELTVSRANFYE